MGKILVKCSVCSGIYYGKIPKGGDGSLLLPFKHSRGRIVCQGSYEEANILNSQRRGK